MKLKKRIIAIAGLINLVSASCMYHPYDTAEERWLITNKRNQEKVSPSEFGQIH